MKFLTSSSSFSNLSAGTKVSPEQRNSIFVRSGHIRKSQGLSNAIGGVEALWSLRALNISPRISYLDIRLDGIVDASYGGSGSQRFWGFSLRCLAI